METRTINNKSAGGYTDLLQLAIERKQPINITLSAGDLIQTAEYIAGLRIAAEKERIAAEQELNDNGDDVTQAEAKQMLHGISSATMWRYVQKGLLHKKNIGGKVFYSRTEISKLLEG